MCVNFQPMMMMMMIIMMMMTTIIDDANDDDDDNNNNLVGGRDAGLYVCQLSTHPPKALHTTLAVRGLSKIVIASSLSFSFASSSVIVIGDINAIIHDIIVDIVFLQKPWIQLKLLEL